MRCDAKFNAIVTRMLGQYINFRARKTAADIKLGNDEVTEICKEIWQQIDSFVGSNYPQVIMVLLLTHTRNYPLDVVLYPLFDKTHELIQRSLSPSFPKILVIILAVLFYKHWLQMCTTDVDVKTFTDKAKISLEKFGLLPFKNDIPKKYIGLTRYVDDKIKQYMYYVKNRKVWYDQFILIYL